MWFKLSSDHRRRLKLESLQAIRPAPDGQHAELTIGCQVVLCERVLFSTPRVIKLDYTIEELQATLRLDAQPEVPWPDPTELKRRSFELMLTDRGAVIVPEDKGPSAKRLTSWLGMVIEDLRSSWPVPPEGLTLGQRFDATPVLPDLPQDTLHAEVHAEHQVVALALPPATIDVTYRVLLRLKDQQAVVNGEGAGQMVVVLHEEQGLMSAKRQSTVVVGAPDRRRQVMASQMQITSEI